MRMAAHELHDLHELTMSCVNSITNMAYMLQHVQDTELKSIVEKHFPLHVRDYNMKVEFLTKMDGAKRELSIMKVNRQLSDFTQSPTTQYPPIQPRIMIQEMNDREMATAYLLTLKRAGREYAWTAMETANPEMRSFFETAFLMSCSHAYDVWQYMVKKGFYPLEAANQDMVSKIGSVYQIVPENQEQIQHYQAQYQNSTQGESNNLYQ